MFSPSASLYKKEGSDHNKVKKFSAERKCFSDNTKPCQLFLRSDCLHPMVFSHLSANHESLRWLSSFLAASTGFDRVIDTATV